MERNWSHGGVHEEAALEELQIDERRRPGAPRVQDEADQERAPDGDGAEAEAAAVRRLLEAVEERDEAGRDEQKPGGVEGAALGGGRVRGQEARGEGDGEDADRKVHVEEPRPGRVLEDRAGDDGAEDRRHQDGHDGVAEGARHLLAGDAGHHELGERREEPARHPLQDARADQHRHRARGAARHRRRREEREAADVEALRAERGRRASRSAEASARARGGTR